MDWKTYRVRDGLSLELPDGSIWARSGDLVVANKFVAPFDAWLRGQGHKLEESDGTMGMLHPPFDAWAVAELRRSGVRVSNGRVVLPQQDLNTRPGRTIEPTADDPPPENRLPVVEPDRMLLNYEDRGHPKRIKINGNGGHRPRSGGRQ